MADVGRCRDCRWWGVDDDLAGHRGSRACARLTDYRSDMAWAVPAAGADFATVDTVPDFGCVEFERKD